MGAIGRFVFKTGTTLAFATAGYVAARLCYDIGKDSDTYWAGRARDLNLSFDEAAKYKDDREKATKVMLSGCVALLVLTAMSVPTHEADKLRRVLDWQDKHGILVRM